MHVYAAKSNVIFLLACKDERGVLRFPTSGQPLPGLHFQPDMKLPISEQLVSLGREKSGGEDTALEVEQKLVELLSHDGGEYAVYLGTSSAQAPADWFTMPEMIRVLPKNRVRLSYMKAWQVLSGGFEANTKVLENVDLQDMLDTE